MTTHVSEDALVLHRYGELPEAEAQAVAQHLRACDVCQREYAAIERVLATVAVAADDVPEPPLSYERDVWVRIQDRLQPAPRGWRALLATRGWDTTSAADAPRASGLRAWWAPAALAAAVAVLLASSAAVLRHLPASEPRMARVTPAASGEAAASAASGGILGPASSGTMAANGSTGPVGSARAVARPGAGTSRGSSSDEAETASAAADAASSARSRVLLAAVDEHLQRSEFMLMELHNLDARGQVDLSGEQAVAAELVSDNRLYRRTAVDVGDRQTASLLDELERALLDVAHAPSSATPEQLEELRMRLDAQGVLFKVRVAGAGMRERQMAAVLVPGAQVQGS